MNKPRLIDANEAFARYQRKLTRLIDGGEYRFSHECMKIRAIMSAIEDQPTAYDIDKVVEQLGKCVNEEIYLWASDEDDYDEEGKLIVRKITDLHKYGSECFDKAIGIVKGGGLDE